MTLNITTLVIGGDPALLAETLFGLKSQSRQSDQVLVIVFDQAQQQLAQEHDFPFLVTDKPAHQAIRQGLDTQTKPGWVWLLSFDSCPDPNALQRLATKAEISPSAAVVAPKLVDWDQPKLLREYGQSLTPLGSLFSVVENEMDQGQFDTQDDVLGASLEGSLLETDILLSHIDTSSPVAAKGLEIGISAWSSGRRVLREPGAKVRILKRHNTLGVRPKLGVGFSKKQASLYLALISSPLPVLLLRWLLLPITSVFASIGHLVSKKPAMVISEALGVIWGWLRLPRILAGHRRIRGFGKLSALKQLRVDREQIANRRRKRFSELPMAAPGELSKGLLGGPWAWLLPLLVLLNYQMWPTAEALTGGTTIPLSAQLRNIFEATASTSVPADPYSWWLLLLGSISFWQPSLAVSVFALLAPMLAFAGSWKLLSAVSSNNLVRTLGALVYALSLVSVSAIAVVNFSEISALVLLPWFMFAVSRLLSSNASARAWRWSALSAILFAMLSTVSLLTVLVLIPALLVLGVIKWRRAGFLVWVLVPAAAINYEVIAFWLVNNPAATLVNPGVAVVNTAGFDIVGNWGALLLVLLPLAVIGVMFQQRIITSVLFLASVLLSGLILVLADIEINLVTSSGLVTTPVAAYSLAGLVVLTLVVLAANSVSLAPKWLQLVSAIAVFPIIGVGGFQLLTESSAEFGSAKTAPAIVEAQSVTKNVNTLVITQGEPLVVEIVSGDGIHLEDLNRIDYLGMGDNTQAEPLAKLAAGLLAGNSQDLDSLIAQLEISFVVLSGVDAITASELDRLDNLDIAGQTEFGSLWRTGFEPSDRGPLQPTQHQLLVLILIALYLVVAIPTPASIRGRARAGNEIFGGES